MPRAFLVQLNEASKHTVCIPPFDLVCPEEDRLEEEEKEEAGVGGGRGGWGAG